MTGMDWDEFERRGEERRQRRDYPPRADRLTVVLGCVIFCIVVFWIVWGLMA